MKSKLLILIAATSFISLSAFATTLDEIDKPKPPAYRVGTTDAIEKKYTIINPTTKDFVKKSSTFNKIDLNSMSYSDSSLKMLSKELSEELEVDFEVMFSHLRILWSGAVSKSETIKFALYKLSNPDEDAPKQSAVKKVLKPLAGLSTLAGAGIADPVIATSAFMSGSILNIFSVDEKALNYKFTKINDADMIVLIRKIDNLQRDIVNRYCDYIRDKDILAMQSEILKKRKQAFDYMQQSSNESLLITDAYYRNAIDLHAKAQTQFLTSRSLLEQLVGKSALNEFEVLLYKPELLIQDEKELNKENSNKN